MSHQNRREPLPPDYQFGDAKPKIQKENVVLTRSAFWALHSLLEEKRQQSYRYFEPPTVPHPFKICLGDMTFIEEPR
jgi:hypothetical protein